MPKIHDACQLIAEEAVRALSRFEGREAAYALALAFHALEEDLIGRHPQAEVIASHAWLVLDGYLREKGLSFEDSKEQTLREDDVRLAYYIHDVVECGRRMFPTPSSRRKTYDY